MVVRRWLGKLKVGVANGLCEVEGLLRIVHVEMAAWSV